MIESIKISGFKNFRGRSVELKGLKRINLLVGINGSGKSSVLELLMGVSKLSGLRGDGEQDILLQGLNTKLHSLYEPETEVTFSYLNSPDTYTLKITPHPGDRWTVKKTGISQGGTSVVALLKKNAVPYSDHVTSSNVNQHPFGGISAFEQDKAIVLPDLLNANEVLKKVNPGQRGINTRNLSSGQFTFESENEIREEFLAGGTRYIAGLIAAVRELDDRKPLLLVDDLGDELFPAVRKLLIPELNDLIVKSTEKDVAQVFATSHNIEIVRSALNHPEYCSVYMFDYDGSLIEFNNSKQKAVRSSDGIGSADAIPAIAKMLGLGDVDLGYPELVMLVEEETKKSFLEGLASNGSIKDKLRSIDVLVPFQDGDGGTSKAIKNMLDLSKYLFFSEIWSDRFVIFVDYNETDYETSGVAKTTGRRQQALCVAQEKLGADIRFLLTKKGEKFVTSLEDTYPMSLWESFKRSNEINSSDIKNYLDDVDVSKKGKLKNELASYVGKNITETQLQKNYPSLAKLLLETVPLPMEDTDYTPAPPIIGEEDFGESMYLQARRVVIESGKASASLLQRRLRVGYARAARLMDELEDDGVIGPINGARPRDVILTTEDM
jgi:hypothetical protein